MNPALQSKGWDKNNKFEIKGEGRGEQRKRKK